VSAINPALASTSCSVGRPWLVICRLRERLKIRVPGISWRFRPCCPAWRL